MSISYSRAAGDAPDVDQADQPDQADQIIANANRAYFYAGKDSSARAVLEIVDANGSTRTREFTVLRSNVDDGGDGGDQMMYVYFHKPGDVRKTVFLVHKHVAGDDDRWMYLPALDLERRIAASDDRTSFVGSHFFYEDVSGRLPSEDMHRFVEETASQYVFESTPKRPGAVEFVRYKLWIDKKNFLPMRIEYEDAASKMYRVVTAEKVEDIEGHPTVTEARVEDRNTGGHTTLRFTQVHYDLGIPDDVFAPASVQRPPPRRYVVR